MRRRILLLALLLLPAPALGQLAPDAAARQRELEAWWQRQHQREAEERMRDLEREQRRQPTEWQVQRWTEQFWRARGWRSYPW
jgi:hypothetical protein